MDTGTDVWRKDREEAGIRDPRPQAEDCGATRSWKRREGPSPGPQPPPSLWAPGPQHSENWSLLPPVICLCALGRPPWGAGTGRDWAPSGGPAHHLCDLLQRDLVVTRVVLGQSPRGRDSTVSPVRPLPPSPLGRPTPSPRGERPVDPPLYPSPCLCSVVPVP